jgi:hypothetical protein
VDRIAPSVGLGAGRGGAAAVIGRRSGAAAGGQACRRKESHASAGGTAVLADRERPQQAAAGPTALAAEAAGKVWLFTLGPKGGVTPGASRVAEIGPVPQIAASEYLLRINRAGGPPGAKTPVHTHPGSEAFYVLTGTLGQKTPHGVGYAEAGATMNGHGGADMPMEVFSAGASDLDQLVMFVVDANRPFSSPAKFD